MCVSVFNHLHGLYFKDIIYFEDIVYFVIMFLEQLAEEKLSNILIYISVAKSVITQIVPFHGFSCNPFAPISNNLSTDVHKFSESYSWENSIKDRSIFL